MAKERIIDLSSPIQQTPPDSDLKVDIEYINHQDGRRRILLERRGNTATLKTYRIWTRFPSPSDSRLPSFL